MKIAVFSSKSYDKQTLNNENTALGLASELSLEFFESRLSEETAVLTNGFDAVSCFVNDKLDESVLQVLKENGIKAIALRCAGYNNVDLDCAHAMGIHVYNVPDYSPDSVAEHALALIMALNRKTHRAHYRVKEGNFSLEGLMGFNVSSKTVGCIGTGRIGKAFVKIMRGFGCRVVCYDAYPSEEVSAWGCEYHELDALYAQSDIISLHCPLTPETKHLINASSLNKMKDGVMIINTSRGALVNAQEAIDALYSGKIGYLGLDVYEQEGELFFEDMSGTIIQDSVFQLMLTFPNVLVTGHQGYFTDVALSHIAQTTLQNLHAHFADIDCKTQL